jgi:2-keto-3-deoxy-L-rhamnonate aldolase RhmA
MTEAVHFREKLKKGELCLGTIITFTDSTVTEALCRDLDFVWIDMEHNALTTEHVQLHCMATKGSQASPLVRVPWNDPVLIKPVLDVGAAGVVVPLVRTVEDAQRAVAACQYPPRGIRGYGPRRPSEYGRKGGPEFCAQLNEEVLTILQIEHLDAVRSIDAILSVPGVSTVMIGSNDLSGSMGLMGQPRHPEVIRAIERVLEAARAAGVPVGIVGDDAEVIAEWVKKGMQWFVLGCDYSLMVQGLDRVIRDVRSAT